jgi:RNA exonuclease 1
MFTSKGLFSEIACPYQQSCMLPRCIFWHPEAKDNATPAAVKNPDEIDLDAEEDGRRKRLKQDKVGKKKIDSMEQWMQKSKEIKEPLSSKSTLDERLQGRISAAATRDISPPPLRRKAANGTPIPVKQSSPQSGSAASTLATPKAQAKTPIKTPLKQEALNPRVLKTPTPATHDMRYRLLKALYEQFNRLNSELANDANDAEEKLVLSDQALITKALDLEEEAAARPAIYSNLVKNKILVYKRMNVSQWKNERESEVAKAEALETAFMSDTPVSKPIEPPKPIETGLSPSEELSLLHRIYTPIAGLSKHGYVTSIPTEEDIDTAKQGVEAAKGWEVCDRCKSRFRVFPGRREEDGALASSGTCTYHFGKPFWQEHQPGDPKAKRDKKYRCCGQSMGDSTGCTKADNHVFKITEVKRLAAVLNFAKTPENPEKESSNPVCIDGEMGYTVHGLELIRLTATSWPNGDELFDVLVRPIGEILDLNSRYSGVWPQHMAGALPFESNSRPDRPTDEKRKLRIVPSPAAARYLLFSHLSPQTPLIGHGLENDLNAVRIIHPTIIDTALLFPHKAGLPYRNGLKNLMYTHLNRHIQVVVDGKMDGHDSKEDANAAGMLVRYKLGEQWRWMQRDGWTLVEGECRPPVTKQSMLVGMPTGPSATSSGPSTFASDRIVSKFGIDSTFGVGGVKRTRDEIEKDEVEDGEVDA